MVLRSQLFTQLLSLLLDAFKGILVFGSRTECGRQTISQFLFLFGLLNGLIQFIDLFCFGTDFFFQMADV